VKLIEVSATNAKDNLISSLMERTKANKEVSTSDYIVF